MGHTPQECRRGAHRWTNHLSLWYMASVTPDLRLPSQTQGITAPILLGDRGRCVWTTCPILIWKWNDRESQPRPFVSQANTVTNIPPGHSSVDMRAKICSSVSHMAYQVRSHRGGHRGRVPNTPFHVPPNQLCTDLCPSEPLFAPYPPDSNSQLNKPGSSVSVQCTDKLNSVCGKYALI